MPRMKYSSQARFMIDQLGEFSYEDFEKWWEREIVIGSNNILEYLMATRKVPAGGNGGGE